MNHFVEWPAGEHIFEHMFLQATAKYECANTMMWQWSGKSIEVYKVTWLQNVPNEQ